MTESDFSEILTPISAYEKAALSGNDPRCAPRHLTEPAPIGNEIVYPAYSILEHRIWQSLYRKQSVLLPNRACDDFMNGLGILNLNPNQIPSLKELSSRLEKATNWKIARVPGLLHEQDFFKFLSERIF